MSYYDQYKKIKDMIVSDRDEWKELGYKYIEEELIERTVSFIDKVLDNELLHIDLDFPEFLPCPDGTIIINWEESTFNLLINFPIKKEDQIDYYFKYFKNEKQSINGICSFGVIKDLIMMWLAINIH